MRQQGTQCARLGATIFDAKHPRAPRRVANARKCYAAPQSTSFNDPSGEAEKEVPEQPCLARMQHREN
jgi:hypothetical protein